MCIIPKILRAVRGLHVHAHVHVELYIHIYSTPPRVPAPAPARPALARAASRLKREKSQPSSSSRDTALRGLASTSEHRSITSRRPMPVHDAASLLQKMTPVNSAASGNSTIAAHDHLLTMAASSSLWQDNQLPDRMTGDRQIPHYNRQYLQQQQGWALSAAGATRETVLIIGASRGLGLSLAKVYAAAGARVHATARITSTAARLKALAVQHPLLTVHPLEVRDRAQLASLARTLNGTALAVLIYNAGTNTGDLETQSAINAQAPFAVVEKMLPAMMIRRDAARRICLITSDLGTPVRAEAMSQVSQQAHNYALSKMAANTRFRAVEPWWRALGITAIAMQPGKVKTSMNARGNVSPLKSASAIKMVLDRLTPDKAGSFLNYLGVHISWETGRPCAASGCKSTAIASHHRPKRKAARTEGDGASGTVSGARPSKGQWQPLIGTPSEVLQQDPDPLRTLSRGEVPAIVLKKLIDPNKLAEVKDRLFKLFAQKRVWTTTGSGGYMGIAFTSALKWNLSPRRYASLAPKVTDTFRRHGVYGPIEALYSGLRALSKGRTVRTARDVSTNLSFSPATYRMQPNGTMQPKHIDSLQAFERLACRTGCGTVWLHRRREGRIRNSRCSTTCVASRCKCLR